MAKKRTKKQKAEAVAKIAAAADDVHESVNLLNVAALGIDDLTWEQAADIYDLLAVTRKVQLTIEAALVRRARQEWRRLGIKDATEVPGVGVVNVRAGAKRVHWDNEGMARAVVDAHIGEHGELPDPWEVVDWIIEAAGFNYWRTTVIKPLDIDPDEFSHIEYGSPSIQVTGGRQVMD